MLEMKACQQCIEAVTSPDCGVSMIHACYGAEPQLKGAEHMSASSNQSHTCIMDKICSLRGASTNLCIKSCQHTPLVHVNVHYKDTTSDTVHAITTLKETRWIKLAGLVNARASKP